jgi:oligopeptidase A
MPQNPLLEIPFDIPFPAVKPEHVEPAIGQLIAESKARIDAIAAQAGTLTYENTLALLDRATEPLDVALNIVRHLEDVATTPELRAAYNAVQGDAAAFYSSIVLHEGLWKTLQAYSETPDAQSLTGVRKRHLAKTLDEFKRSGAALPPEGKKRLEAINVELTTLTTRFSQKVLDSTNAWELYLESESDLAGLPPSALGAARQSAESKGKPGYRFTLQAPSYIAVMTYLDNREIRERMYRAYSTRASAPPHDNRGLIVQILALRAEKARLLGFHNFADLVLADRMAKNGAAALGFLHDLRARTEAHFARENQALEEFAGFPLQPWDVAYYAEKLRQKLYDFDEEQLRPYFPLPKVMEGMFALTEKIFAIRVTEKQGAPVWHPDVRFFEVRDARNGAHLGSFYSDFYPREEKRGGAWMDSFLTGLPTPKGHEPHLGLICGNLTPPIGGAPALLTHREVETIFHEFGHLLHHVLTRVPVRALAGTSVAWDFVELPSQIMENWCWEREALDLFARHFESQAPIPQDLFERMRRARTFRAATAQMRQISFGLVDFALHIEYDPAKDGDVIAYSRRILQPLSAAPLPQEHAMVAGFTHLFSSPVGYAAGYYSYKWAEVLDADAFSRFHAEGVFNETVGLEFREKILAKGDSEDPADLYRSFMGRDPDPEALLRRSALV